MSRTPAETVSARGGSGVDAADRTRRAGLTFAVLGALAFSAKAIVVKLSYRHGVDAVTVIMLRMGFALPMFVALAWWGGRGRPALTRRDWASVAGLGFCGYYLASFLDFLGLMHISASLERLILYLNPTMVLLLGWVLYGRRATARQGVALAVGYSGVLLVFGQEALAQGPQVLWGSLLVFGSALSYAFYLIVSGEVVKRIGALRLTGLATSVACGLSIGQFVLLRPLSAVAEVPAPVLALGLFNAVACTFAPVLLVMLAIERVGSVMAAQAGMLGPLMTVALGVWLLGEPFNTGVLAGTALVLAGVWMLARAR